MKATTISSMPLTPRQLEIIRLIARKMAEDGRSPTFRELMAELGIESPNGITCHLRSLARRGLVEHGKRKGIPHSIRLIGARLVFQFDHTSAGDRLAELLQDDQPGKGQHAKGRKSKGQKGKGQGRQGGQLFHVVGENEDGDRVILSSHRTEQKAKKELDRCQGLECYVRVFVEPGEA